MSRSKSAFPRCELLVPNASCLATLLRVTDSRSGDLHSKVQCGSMSVLSQPPKPRRPRPPHNPGVREWVESKRRSCSPPKLEDVKQGFRGWHERGYLPHRDSPGLTQFITYHLADAFPAELRGEWAALLKIEEEAQRRRELEKYLDKGRGQCWLRRPEVANICETAFRHFDGERYQLRAWCLMPNHVHVLVSVSNVPMAES